MKTMKHFFSIIILLAIATAGNAAKKFVPFTKSLSQEKAIEASYPISITHRYGDIEVSLWDKQAVKIDVTISGNLQEGEDAEALCKDILEGLIKVNRDVLISTPIEDYNTNMIVLGTRKIINADLKLNNGNKYKVSELKVQMHIFLPDRHKLAIQNKYHDISMGNYGGDLAVSVDNGSFIAGELRGESRVSMKYGTVRVSKATRLAINSYDGHVNVADADQLDVNSKYSNVSIDHCNEANLSSYDDDISTGDFQTLKYSSKYSSFNGGNVESITADLYDGQLELKNVSQVTISAKYADIEMDVVGSMRMADSYDNHVKIELVDQLLLSSSKYSSYRIGVILGSLTLDGYDDDFIVGLIASGAEDINMRIKYGEYKFKFDKDYGHSIKVSSTHGNVDYPKSYYTISSQNTSGSSNTLEATTIGYVGNNSIVIDAYSSDIDLDLK